MSVKKGKGLIAIKIDIDKSLVTFTPENEEEKAKLTALWKIMIDCVKDTRKMVPVGEYVPQKSDRGATFQIEGLEAGDISYARVTLEEAGRVVCMTCNKFLDLQAGEAIPLCCGKIMVVAD